MSCFYCDKTIAQCEGLSIDELVDNEPCEDCFLRMVIWMPHKVRLWQNAMAEKADMEGK